MINFAAEKKMFNNPIKKKVKKMTGKKKTGIIIVALGMVVGILGVGLLNSKQSIVSNRQHR